MTGPRGQHSSLDSYDGAPAQAPVTVSGFLVPPPKQINAGDAKVGPRKGGQGRINRDSFNE
jgi:hypothetical protein